MMTTLRSPEQAVRAPSAREPRQKAWSAREERLAREDTGAVGKASSEEVSVHPPGRGAVEGADVVPGLERKTSRLGRDAAFDHLHHAALLKPGFDRAPRPRAHVGVHALLGLALASQSRLGPVGQRHDELP